MKLSIPIVALFLLAAAPVATAQPGPAPGYDDPVSYANAYANERGSDIADDPQGEARDLAYGGASEEVDHGAYVACWVIYDASNIHDDELCGEHFQPPEDAEPDQPPAEEQTDVAQKQAEHGIDMAGDVVDETRGLGGEALNTVEKSGRDPLGAIGHVLDFADAASEYGASVARAASGYAIDTVNALVDTIGLGISNSMQALQALGAAIASGSQAAAGAVGALAIASGNAISDAAAAVSDAVLALFGEEPQAPVGAQDVDAVELPDADPEDLDLSGTVGSLLS